jgi:hypothetical protein
MIQYNKADEVNRIARSKGSMVDSDRSVNNRARALALKNPMNCAEAIAAVRAKGSSSKMSMYRTIKK